jgi:hypothetical protein
VTTATNIAADVPAPSNEETDLAALRTLVVDCPELRELEQRLGRLNLFEVLRTEHHEARHSNMLAWLFDPSENHGFRELFLRRWLMRVFHDAERGSINYLDPVDVDSIPFKSVQVFREWMNVDLLVEIVTEHDDTWVVCVENKVWSWQHSNQLQRYRTRIEQAYPNAKRFYILLSVTAEEPEDAAYAIATYEQVKLALETCMAERQGVLGGELVVILNHYIGLIKANFMTNSPVEELALKIYKAHKRALDRIFEYRPDTVALLTDAVVARMKVESSSLQIVHVGQTKGAIYFLPTLWEAPNNKRPGGATAIFCEINFYYMDRVVLKAIAGPTEQGWRRQLFELSKTRKFKNTQAKKSLPDQWFQFFGIMNKSLKLAEAEPGSVDDVSEKMWSWIVEQLKQPTFTEMVSAVAEHLKTHPTPSA